MAESVGLRRLRGSGERSEDDTEFVLTQFRMLLLTGRVKMNEGMKPPMSVEIMRTPARAGIWERVMLSEDPTPVAARALLKLQFGDPDKARMRELSAKARAGTLTPGERDEIEQYERVACTLDILHSKARRVLKRRSA